MSDGPAGRRSPREPWGGVSPFSIKTKLGALVVISVLITTGLMMIAVHTKTELRFITVFSMIATLLITQFVAHSLTAPLDEMNAVARSISHGDYTRRVRENRRDELGDLAQTINRMADDLEAQDRQRKELVANVSHELRTPDRGAAGGAGEHRRRGHRGRPRDHAHGPEADRAARPAGGDAAGPVPAGQRRRTAEEAAFRGVAVPVGRAEGGQHGRHRARGHRVRVRQSHAHRRPSAPRRVPAGADRARRPGAHPPGRRQPHRQRGQAQPAARPGHGARRGAGPCRSRWSWRSSTRAPAFRARSGTASSSGSTAAASCGRTVRAATAAPDSGSRSRAGRWICTAAGSEWPNPSGAAGFLSPFRDFHLCQVDVKFEAEPQDPRAFRADGHV